MTNVYESCSMYEATGETLRPGGFALTKRAIERCRLHVKTRILDLGCGRGATASYLYQTCGIKVVGIDPSEKLLNIAQARNPQATFVKGFGDALPFENESFECVMAECTLSLMRDLHVSLREVNRVLEKDGWLVIHDVYAKNPTILESMRDFTMTSCMRGMHDLEQLQVQLEQMGFNIVLVEDCTALLKELMVKIIFTHGSMAAFWSKAIEGETPQGCCSFDQRITQCKPGYFMLIAQKGGDTHG